MKHLIKHLVEFVRQQCPDCCVAVIPVDTDAPLANARFDEIKICFWNGNAELDFVVSQFQLKQAVSPKFAVESLAAKAIGELFGPTLIASIRQEDRRSTALR